MAILTTGTQPLWSDIKRTHFTSCKFPKNVTIWNPLTGTPEAMSKDYTLLTCEAENPDVFTEENGYPKKQEYEPGNVKQLDE